VAEDNELRGHTILAAILASVDPVWTVGGHMTFFLTDTTSASELARIGTVGLVLREGLVERGCFRGGVIDTYVALFALRSCQ
jgi:hypothetical protein